LLQFSFGKKFICQLATLFFFSLKPLTGKGLDASEERLLDSLYIPNWDPIDATLRRSNKGFPQTRACGAV